MRDEIASRTAVRQFTSEPHEHRHRGAGDDEDDRDGDDVKMKRVAALELYEGVAAEIENERRADHGLARIANGDGNERGDPETLAARSGPATGQGEHREDKCQYVAAVPQREMADIPRHDR